MQKSYHKRVSRRDKDLDWFISDHFGRPSEHLKVYRKVCAPANEHPKITVSRFFFGISRRTKLVYYTIAGDRTRVRNYDEKGKTQSFKY